MMTPQIFKFVNFTKTQKSRHFKNKTFFLKKKTTTLTVHQGLLYAKKRFAAEVIFSRRPQNQKKLLRKNRSPPRQMLPPKCNLPSYESKNCHIEKYVTPAYKM